MIAQAQYANFLKESLQNYPAEAKAWLADVDSGMQKLPEKFNWLGFAEVAALNAHTESNLLWAEVAISVYERLAQEAKDKANDASRDSADSATISAMMLRAASIAKHGSISGDRVLDVNRIISWFWDSLTISRQEAATLAAKWTELSIEKIRELRQIKNRLGVISLLADSEKCVSPELQEPELQAWLSLRRQLP